MGPEVTLKLVRSGEGFVAEDPAKWMVSDIDYVDDLIDEAVDEARNECYNMLEILKRDFLS